MTKKEEEDKRKKLEEQRREEQLVGTKGEMRPVEMPSGSAFILPERERRALEEKGKAIPQEEIQRRAQEKIKEEEKAQLTERQIAELEELGKLTPEELAARLDIAKTEGERITILGELKRQRDFSLLRGEFARPEIAIPQAGMRAGALALGLGVGAGAIGLAAGKVGGSLGLLKGWGATMMAGFGVYNLGKIHSQLTKGKEADIQSNITDLRTLTRDVVTDVTKGADSQEAIDRLREVEEDIKERLGQLHLITSSPINTDARIINRDIQTFMERNLEPVIRRRHAIERYQLDGDVEALARYGGDAESIPLE